MEGIESEKINALNDLEFQKLIRIEKVGTTKKHFITPEGESWLAYENEGIQ